MSCIRPATPGFLITLIATILLVVVSFCVPYFKSVYFLRADISVGGNNGSITFGTLGYCLELSNGTKCSSPSIGYQLDINGLVGNNFNVKIPQVAVKWLTYALFLHVIALILAAGSTLFGLLAHVREMSMACCSTCISGFAAGITFVAFIFDIALFFIAKARINAIGRASIGNAIWLTLAAWILLFFSGCFFMVGRCCISKRGSRSQWGAGESHKNDTHFEDMRMAAIKADAQRSEANHPENKPLVAKTVYFDGDTVFTTPPADATGYQPGHHGSRAIDAYEKEPPSSVYRQNSSTTPQPSTEIPPSSHNQYLGLSKPPEGPYGYSQEPHSLGNPHGHAGDGSSYYTAPGSRQTSEHLRGDYSYSQYNDNYPYSQPTYNAPTPPVGVDNGYPPGNGYGSNSVPPLQGNGYGANSVPPLQGYGASSVPPPASIDEAPPPRYNTGTPVTRWDGY